METYKVGMAIPRRISFLEESKSRGIAKLHSSGIEEYEIYSSGSSGNFRGMSYPKNTENPQKLQKSFEKKISALNLYFKVQNVEWWYQKLIGNPEKQK